jgi:hypothetical protein
MSEREVVRQAREPEYYRVKPFMVYKPVEFTQTKTFGIHSERTLHGTDWANNSKLNSHMRIFSMVDDGCAAPQAAALS